MRTLVQISDLHFGAILESTLEPLVAFLRELAPDLTIISGDLTQRATREQYLAARQYLGRLPQPQIVVPGNHDIPLYNVLRRFATPLDHYTRYIASDLDPTFLDDEIAVVAINSARSLTFKGGAISTTQRDHSARTFARATNGQVRIAVAHHPFDIPVGLSGVRIVRGARKAVESFAASQVDLILTGHLHLIHRAPGSVFVRDYKALMQGAGTATSTRARGESNSFFVFRIDSSRSDDGAIRIETWSWNAARNGFELTDTRSAPRTSQPIITARAAE
ncbi:MAG: metallophosphoesterase family protein [Gemmatimonas sp.]